MIKAVLLDLDNTLLQNPDITFAQNFLSLFEAHFLEAGIKNAGTLFRKAIQQMGQGQSGDVRNQDLVMSFFDDEDKQVSHTFEQFYATVYPRLQQCISPIDGAADLIRKLRDMGYKVVIATNPIYPEIAIRQRMAWANLPLDDDLYAFITSSDTMHFAKPDPAYYAEILGRIHVEPDEALMVGDKIRNDIIPAQTVGLQTYHVADLNLEMFVQELDLLLEDVQPLQLQSEMIEPQLRGNIGAIFGFLDTVEDHYWHQHPEPNEWSIIQILCHLVTAENDNERKRLKTILTHDNPFITHPKQSGPNIDTCAGEGYSIAYDFMQTRQETIAFVEQFTAEDWKRPARHSIFGLTTMLEMAYFTAQHDRLHLEQLCQTIGRCE